MLFKINKKLITLIMLSILCFVVAVCLIDCIEVKKSNDFISYTGQYNSPQHEIYSYSTPTEVTTTNMSELYSINNNAVTSTNVNVVGTINIMNETDLYAF